MKYLIVIAFALTLSACKAIDEIVGAFVEYASPPSEVHSKASDPVRVLPPNPTGCPVWEKDTIVEITESMTLPAGCKYDRVGLLISNQSDLVLDCNGAELNGLDKEFRQGLETTYSVGQEPLLVGIQIQSAEFNQSLNITERNCNLRNYVRGIRVHFGINAAALADLKNNVNVSELESHLRSISPKNIRVENSTINFSHKDGVYVSRYVTDFVLDKSTVNSTGAVGVYLDSGSGNNTVSNSSFSKNGFSDYDIGSRKRIRRIVDYTREALAIDSSINNRIEKNTFTGNSRGSVFIYKNCNEHFQNPNQIPRYQSADGNVISGNSFETDKIGVWIASRQSQDLRALECGSPLIATGEIRYGNQTETTHFYEDFAKNNQVLNNTFNNVRTGVIVEDDNSIVRGNTFTGPAKNSISVGTHYRTTVLNNPVTNTLIDTNTFNSTASPHIELQFTPVNTVITNNVPAEVND